MKSTRARGDPDPRRWPRCSDFLAQGHPGRAAPRYATGIIAAGAPTASLLWVLELLSRSGSAGGGSPSSPAGGENALHDLLGSREDCFGTIGVLISIVSVFASLPLLKIK